MPTQTDRQTVHLSLRIMGIQPGYDGLAIFNQPAYFKPFLAGEPHTSNPSRCHRNTSTESISWNPSSVAMTVRGQGGKSIFTVPLPLAPDSVRLPA